MAKITMQDIANELNISRVTVSKAFNGQTGVSEALRDVILEKAREMGYTSSKLADESEEQTISLIVSRPDSSTFWTNIIHRMAQELAEHNINLMYTYLPSNYSDGFTLPPILTSGMVQAAIVLNVYDAELIALINELDLPKVFLDTVPEIDNLNLSGDLILLEGQATLYNITESILERGYTRLGFIGDIQYARTNLDRYHGFCRCMEDHNIPVDESICLTRRLGIFSYYRELSEFLDSLKVLPEAFICASDYLAHFLHRYFSERLDRVPDGILITGYDGSREYSNIDGIITTAEVRTNLLGKRLSMQIIYRMEHPDAPFELTYINPRIIHRDSILTF